LKKTPVGVVVMVVCTVVPKAREHGKKFAANVSDA
jgi:hypothetical protein